MSDSKRYLRAADMTQQGWEIVPDERWQDLLHQYAMEKALREGGGAAAQPEASQGPVQPFGGAANTANVMGNAMRYPTAAPAGEAAMQQALLLALRGR